MRFVRFTEENDNEGETWTFWLQKDGNQKALGELLDLIEQYELANNGVFSAYQLDLSFSVSETSVDILLEYANAYSGAYMRAHHKVAGTLHTPVPQEGQDIIYVLDDALYKGGIRDLFTKESK